MTETSPSNDPGAEATAQCDGGLDCEEALRDLYQYLDGEITDERRADIRVHIEECGHCLEAFDFEAELRELVARTCRREAPESLRDRVAEAIRECDPDAEEPTDR